MEIQNVDLPHPSPSWFCDLYSNTMGLALEVRELLFHERTAYQDVKICETLDFGRVLLLNNYIYRSDRVHYMIPEMLVHVPMRTGYEKKRVLLIGGGDGYSTYELTRYRSLEQIDVIDIDERVPIACAKYFPLAAQGFSDPRVNLHICDGLDFVKRAPENTYDLILVTGTEGKNLVGSPGLSYSLFQDSFFNECKRCLKPDGILLSDASPVLIDIGGYDYSYLTTHLVGIFKVVKTYLLANGGLLGGLFAVTIASNRFDPENDLIQPEYDIPTKYYNSKIHHGAFALPQLMIDRLKNAM